MSKIVYDSISLTHKENSKECFPKFPQNYFDTNKSLKRKKGKLVKSKIPKVKRKKILEPISININSKGNLIIDFGETLSAVINISFLGVKDKSVKLVYAENINEIKYSEKLLA